MATAAPATAAGKLRDITRCPSNSVVLHQLNDADTDAVTANPTTAHANNIISKIGESFLSDIQSVLAPPPLPTSGVANGNVNIQSATSTITTTAGTGGTNKTNEDNRRGDTGGFEFPSHQNDSYDNRHQAHHKTADDDRRADGGFDFPTHSNEAHDNHDTHNNPGTHPNLQSDLFFLDQAMQPQPSPVSVSRDAEISQDPHNHRSMNAINTNGAINTMVGSAELDPHDSLFGGNAAAFTQPLFDDHNKLLAFDGPAVGVDASVVPNAYKTADGGCEDTDLGHVLGTLGIPTTTNTSGRCGNGSGTGRPLQGYYGQEVPLPGSTAFGRQKKRRLSTMSGSGEADNINIYPEGFEDRIAKRAKSDMSHATAGNLYYGERTGGRALYGMGVGGNGNGGGNGAGKARAYTTLNEHYLDGNNMSMPRTTTGPYENLSPELQLHVDALREKIDKMPRRKLRDSLRKNVTIEEVEPLMSINRDDLAEMLGIGVTTWKLFVHTSFDLPRWPARVLKSQQMQEKSAHVRLNDAKLRGDTHATAEIWQELKKIEDKKYKWKNKLRTKAKNMRDKILNTVKNNHRGASGKE